MIKQDWKQKMKKRIDGMAGASGDGDKPVVDRCAEGDIPGQDAFVLRCLNAAVNLYGIVTAKEFCEIYNGYAKDHAAPITEKEVVDSARRLLQNIAEKDDEQILDILDEDAWYSLLRDDGTAEWLFVYEGFTNELTDGDAGTIAPMRSIRTIMRKVAENRARFSDVPFKILPEETFLFYEEMSTSLWGPFIRLGSKVLRPC